MPGTQTARSLSCMAGKPHAESVGGSGMSQRQTGRPCISEETKTCLRKEQCQTCGWFAPQDFCQVLEGVGQEMILQHLQPGRDRVYSPSTGTSSCSPPLNSACGVWTRGPAVEENTWEGSGIVISCCYVPLSPRASPTAQSWPAITAGEAWVESSTFCI